MMRARTIRRVVLAIATVFVAAAIGYSLHVIRGVRKGLQAHEARGRTALAAHRQAFMEDQRRLATLPLFVPRAGKRDAGPLIGPRVRWMLTTPRDGSSASVDGRTLSRTVLEKMGEDWTHAGPDVWGDVDTAWMASLSDFDFWDVDDNSAPADPRFLADPEPAFADLLGWAKVRIAKGAHEGAAEHALSDVQELARLCMTTERFDTQLEGLILLGLVRETRERLAITVPATAIDRDSIRGIQRAIFGAIAFARLETPGSYEDDFGRIAVGRCAALHDGVKAALLFRAELGDARPEDYQRLDRLLAAAPDCRLKWLRQQWVLPDSEWSMTESWWRRAIMMRWIPVVRHYWGEVGLAIGEQDWFRRYEERARATP